MATKKKRTTQRPKRLRRLNLARFPTERGIQVARGKAVGFLTMTQPGVGSSGPNLS
jgi:hypothetical protein